MGELSVRQIVERCQRGDREAFGQLYTAMHGRLRGVCRHFVADDSTADDLLHDAFLLIFSKIHTLKDLAKAEQWMLTVTKNLSLMYLQHHRQEATVSLDAMQERMAAADTGAVQETLSAQGGEEMPVTYDEILHLVDSLPQSYRRVFRLSVLEGMSHQQIAALLNIEPHTSSSQLFRAKRMLRQALSVLLILFLALLLPLGYLWHTLTNPDTLAPAIGPSAPVAVADSTHTLPLLQTTSDSVRVCPMQHTIAQAAGVRVHPSQETPSDSVRIRPLQKKTSDSVRVHPLQAAPADTARVIPQQTTAERVRRHVGSKTPVPAQNGWTVQLAYSGGLDGQSAAELPFADHDWNDAPVDTVSRHRPPITVALHVSRQLGRHWAVGTGLQYTLLRSETQVGNTYAWEVSRQRIGYLGLPLRLQWQPVNTRHWTLYAAGSLMMELPLHKQLKHSTYVAGNEVETERQHLHVPVQWSVGAGTGVEYKLTPSLGFFVEPSLQYFLRSEPETWRTDHPVVLSVPFGLRITF